MKTSTILTIGVVTVLVTTGYLVSVGIVWLLQWLINLTFATSFDLNVWSAGALFYLLWFLLK